MSADEGQTEQGLLAAELGGSAAAGQGNEDKPDMLEMVKQCYFKMVKIRMTYACCAFGVMSAACGVGMGLQQFFMLWMPISWPSAYVLIFVLPATVFFTGFVGSEVSELALDAMQEPPFKALSLSTVLIFGPTIFPGSTFRDKRRKMAYAFIIALEVVCFCATCYGLATGARPSTIFKYIVGVLLLAAGALLVLQVLCQFMVICCPPTERIKKHLSPELCQDSEVQEFEDHKKKLAFVGLTRRHALAGFIAGGVGYLLFMLCLIFKVVNFDVNVYVLFMPSVALLTFGLMGLYPLNGFFPGIVVFFFVAVWVLVGSDMGENKSLFHTEKMPDLMPVFNAPPDEPVFHHHHFNLPSYPICSTTWGRSTVDHSKRLTILDIGVFADAVYEDDRKKDDQIELSANSSFDGTDLREGMALEEKTDYWNIGRAAVFTVPAARVRVVAVRGTTTLHDALADADLYSFITVLQALDKVVPVSSWLNDDLLRTLAKWMSPYSFLNEPQLWEPIEEIAKRAMNRSLHEGYDTVITGHSLGGALAQVVGTHLQIPAIVFSPVGVGNSLFRYHMDKTATFRSVTLVQPQLDVVPKIDKQIGFTQHIECHSTNVAACHTARRTFCELYAVCGDNRDRSIEKSCSHAMGEDEWEKTKKAVRDAREELAATQMELFGIAGEDENCSDYKEGIAM